MNTKKITMSDIARECGVSQTTVSMILNHRLGTFPQETVQKVNQTAERLGYSFRAKKQSGFRDVVLVLVTTTTNPYYSEMIQSIDQAAREQNIQIITGCTYHDSELEGQLLQTAVDCNYLGVLYLFPPDNIEAYEAASKQLHIVALCNRVRRIKGDYVQIDNFEAGRIAARHLLDLGHKKIAVLYRSSRVDTTSGANRLAGILSEIEKDLSRDSLLVLPFSSGKESTLYTRHAQYEIGRTLAQDPRIYEDHITGIICIDDLMAYGVMDTLVSRGYRIPQDFSVIGSDNLQYSSMPQINLTTVNLHMDMVAASAFGTLVNRALFSRVGSSASTARMQVSCAVDLIERGTTGPVA